jgi:uncharacterized protein YdeI (BOF family)
MKDGDTVIVTFEDGCIVKGVMLDHSKGFRNVTVSPKQGVSINGMVKDIEAGCK